MLLPGELLLNFKFLLILLILVSCGVKGPPRELPDKTLESFIEEETEVNLKKEKLPDSIQ